MKFSRSATTALLSTLTIITTAVLLRAQLPSWSEDIVAHTALEAALFRIMWLPGGTVTHIRPPWEGRDHLTALLKTSPHDAGLYSIRAREEELLQDYKAAESDWKLAAGNSADPLASLTELADYYRRRVQPSQEVATLLQLGALPAQSSERFQPDQQQPQWTAFTRAITVANNALLPLPQYQSIFNSWIKRYPRDTEPYQAYLDWALQHHSRDAAIAIAARMKRAFPEDSVLALSTDANLARMQGGANAALAVYARNFALVLQDDRLMSAYFKELGDAHQLRAFLAEAQSEAAAHPADFDAVLHLYFYYRQENRKEAADQQLILFESRKAEQQSAWSPQELRTLARLFLDVQDYDESAHAAYELYEMAGAPAGDKEWTLASLVSLLLNVPEQPLHFGNRDLSLYKNVARMDRHPGFLNGILSLALNTTSPEYQYQSASQTAVSYFHRGSASALLDQFRRQFPASKQTAPLEAALFHAYALYGQDGAIIRDVPAWLVRNRNSGLYVDVALLLADAYIATNQTTPELAIYDRLLADLGAKSEHVPLGEPEIARQVEIGGQPAAAAQQVQPRSPDYARVLDRYISRLVQLNRSMDAVRLYRSEIDRNPDDPGLYERLALFFEQNQLDSDVAQTYRSALAHFKDMTWANKLARFYLHQKEGAAYQDLTKQITDTFKGSQVALFLTDVPPDSAVLYRQINLYAHQRFPQNLVFVRNLLQCYQRKETADYTAYARLLREYWFYDSSLRTEFFQYLNRTGQLQSQLAALPPIERAAADSNIAALQFKAEGEAWLTHYETAAPAFVRLATLEPGNLSYNDRAISVERSLAPEASGAFDSAVHIAEQDVKADPRNLAALTRVGEIYADREMYAQAKPWWNQMATVQPGSSEGYLNAATVFWDYFQFEDALREIGEARRKLGRPALFSYEAGAIYENEGKYKDAVASYVEGALHDSSPQAQNRLITLASRKTAALVEQATSKLTANHFETAAFQLRLAILEKQNRLGDIQHMLAALLSFSDDLANIAEIRTAAERLGFDNLAAQCLEKTVSLTKDPIEKMQARIELGRFYETHNEAARAQNEFSSLLNDHPNILGVIRAAVDFYWREKQGRAAVRALEDAADRAQQPYQKELRREAANKATESGEYQEARRLLDQLLSNDPFNGDLLAAKAATYGRENDQTALVAFYADVLKKMQSAPLASEDKTTRIVALRRGYIPVLIAVSQFREALEQYEQIINAYPEDASLTAEAGRFAEQHELSALLTGYYEKAANDSPRDYRWPLVLARIDTALRRYPEAVAAYDKAAYVRPDRPDIVIAKVDLETRLLRFDDALASYRKLYDLSYHDSQYLAAQADICARMGNQPEALRLLRAAYIDPHPHQPSGFLSAMQQASTWRMFREVDQLFTEARPLFAPNTASVSQALQIETEALVALHRPLDALRLISDVIPDAGQASGFVNTIGAAIQQYLTPEEKFALAQQLHKSRSPVDLLQLATAAGFTEIQGNLLAKESARIESNDWPALNQLQSSRLLYQELGGQLETIAQAHSDQRDYPAILNAAYMAYKNAGDTQAELRLAEVSGRDFARLFVNAGGDLTGRLSELAQHAPQRAYSVMEYLIANGTPDQAVQAIAAGGPHPANLWTASYTALAGLYFLSRDDWVPKAFTTILGPRTVVGELSSPKDSLYNADWFYYAARYGDYLGYRRLPEAPQYLPASLEASPAASDSYVQLANSYLEMNQAAHASELYEYALQLSPARPDVYDRLARLAVTMNRRAQAIKYWRRAFEILAERVEQGPLPPDYWQTAETVLLHMNQFHAVEDLKPEADSMLRAYARRNGAYNFTPFIRGMLDHALDRKAALAWILELSNLPHMNALLDDLLASDLVPDADKDVFYRARVERDRKALASASGTEPTQHASEQLTQDTVGYARYLDSQKRWQDEWSVLQQIDPPAQRPADLVLKTGALTGRTSELLSQYRAKPDSAPSGEQVLSAASSLQNSGHADLALQLEEFEYQRELDSPQSPASAWFGLAQVRIQQKRTGDALSLIRAVTLSSGAPFENLPEAVRVLERAGLNEDATKYAAEWRTAEPWSEDAQLNFARLKKDSKLLNELRQSPGAPYSVRIRAARVLRDMGSPAAGGDELSLLTHRSITAAQASQPFYVEARLDAARQSSTSAEKIRLYREAIALDPKLAEPRLDLAQAAFAANNDVLGLAAFRSYEPARQQPNVEPSPSDKFLAVERLAAQAMARQREFGEAIQTCDDLLNRVHEPAAYAQIKKIRDSIKTKQDLEIANAARAPIVHNEVTQTTIVKPKLKVLPPDWVRADASRPQGGQE